MSTFDGYVKEFPLIRLDYFRTQVSRPQPAACFLSHVHSDHLLGLESLKMPFVYCSATTRRLLLRMEKYPHRINFAKGILETRKQHYRHLKSILRPLPLQAPTEIELSPKLSIRVTLFDANHCPGAVMFLIEGDGRAVLYTGDVRAEPWWVNSTIQNPSLLRYTCELGRLDCIYLDTTFATHEDKYKHFPSKAEGLRELMTKVSRCDPDSIFYFRAWTLGYEQVWITLAELLNCQVHIDEYQMRLFSSIIEDGRDGYSTFEGPPLAGFQVGNRIQPGCLSRDSETRLHSCEPGMPCHAELKHKKVVWITPIISRLTDGTELLELGAGGGAGDLYQTPELDLTDELELQNLELFCKGLETNPTILERIHTAVQVAREAGLSVLSLDGLGLDSDAEVSLKDFVNLVAQQKDWKGRRNPAHGSTGEGKGERTIHFPYSRHSSYEELRHLVSILRPRDVYACTVDLTSWSEELSMKSLFGDLCSGEDFHHDDLVRAQVVAFREVQANKILKRKRNAESQHSESSSQPFSRPSPSFYSARTVPSTEQESRRMPDGDKAVVSAESMRGPLQRTLYSSIEETEATRPDMDARVGDIEQEFLDLNGGRYTVTFEKAEMAKDTAIDPTVDSQVSLDASAFESQEHGIPLDDDIGKDAHRGAAVNRASNRREAYRLARRSIRTGDNSDWNDLSLQSVGRTGHDDGEMEL